MMNFKETYRHLNNAVVPDPELTEALLERARKRTQRQKPVKSHRFGYGAAAAIFCLFAGLLLSMPALAAHADPVYQLLYRLSPRAAQYFMPVQMSAEDQGIRMEVVSARIYENTAEIYIAMEDLTGDRIDETTDLYDSYSIHRPFDATGTCERAGYDAASGRVFFLIKLQEQSGTGSAHSITGDKITFSVQEFLSRKSTYENMVIPLDLTCLPENPKVKETEPNGFSGDCEIWKNLHTAAVLVPNITVSILPSDGIRLTAIGYQDGMLHIQTAMEDTLENDNHGYLWLEDEEGTCESVCSISFQEESENGHSVTYHEQVFDISEERLSGCTLHGRFVISGQKTEGNWRVTFPLE